MLILNGSQLHVQELNPTPERPVRLVARVIQAGETLPLHRHAWGQLTWAHTGTLKVYAGQQIWIVPPTRAIWIPSDLEHTVCALEPTQTRILHIWPSHLPFQDADCRVLEVSPLLKELIRRLEALDQAGKQEEHICQVINDELRCAETLPMHVNLPSDKRLKQVCDYVLKHPDTSMSLSDFATSAGASARTLARLFDQELGMNYALWRQQVRLAHAFVLLSKKWPLSKIAAELGYSSQSAFTAMFKKALGKAPSHFMS